MEELKLHETISFYRKRQGLTQEELAQKLGVTNQSVSKWESAQCCPDIGLLPMLADIFGIGIDELFGRTSDREVHHDLCSELPWDDDNTIRVFRAMGKKILESREDGETINITFPKDCREAEDGRFKIEVFGNMSCDTDINGDVIACTNLKCRHINGDIAECSGNISCGGSINGDAKANGNISCSGNISGDARCGGNLSCTGIGGDVDCRGNIGKIIRG